MISDRVVIEHALREHIGRSATWEAYKRTLPDLNLVLDYASRHVGGKFVLCWVTGGPSAIFCLKLVGADDTAYAITFHERYLVLTSLLRRLMLDPFLEGHREELAERVLLKFMAEFALQQNHGEMAAQAFMKALVGQTLSLGDAGGLLPLVFHTRNEVYMAMWFYGLLHELGHIAASTGSFEAGVLTDERVHRELTDFIEDLPYPPANKRALLHAACANPNHFLSPSHLRSEVLADAFAATMLLETSRLVLGLAGKPFAIDQFLMEQVLIFHVIATLEECSLTVQAAVNPSPEILKVALHKMAIEIRLQLVILHLRSLEPSLRGRRADELLLATLRTAMTGTQGIGEGLLRAMVFLPRWRVPDPARSQAFLAEAKANPMLILDTKSFLDLADSFGTTSPGLDVIRGAL